MWAAMTEPVIAAKGRPTLNGNSLWSSRVPIGQSGLSGCSVKMVSSTDVAHESALRVECTSLASGNASSSSFQNRHAG